MNSTYTKIFVVALILVFWIVGGIYFLSIGALNKTSTPLINTDLETDFHTKEQTDSALYHYNDSRKNTLY